MWPWHLTFQPQNHNTCRISQGHSLYQVWTLWFELSCRQMRMNALYCRDCRRVSIIRFVMREFIKRTCYNRRAKMLKLHRTDKYGDFSALSMLSMYKQYTFKLSRFWKYIQQRRQSHRRTQLGHVCTRCIFRHTSRMVSAWFLVYLALWAKAAHVYALVGQRLACLRAAAAAASV